MTFSSLMIDLCTIQRFSEGAQDEYGHPLQTWTNLHTSIPCRLVYGKGTEITVGQQVLVVHEEVYLEVVDVTTEDRIIVNGTTFEILDVSTPKDYFGDHHKRLFVRRVE